MDEGIFRWVLGKMFLNKSNAKRCDFQSKFWVVYAFSKVLISVVLNVSLSE